MKPADLVRSKWMTAEDFGRDNVPKEPTVTIDKVSHQKMGKGDVWGVIHFKEEWAKPLKANTTFRNACERMFGDRDTDDWLNHRITLYAKPGIYPNGKKFAVRIKGSPDIKATVSFRMRGFGGEETYNLVPTGGQVKLGPGVVRFGRNSGAWGKPFSDFDDEQLQQLMLDAEAFLRDPKNANGGKGWPDVEANVKEIFDHLKERIESRVPPPDPEVPPAEEAPL